MNERERYELLNTVSPEFHRRFHQLARSRRKSIYVTAVLWFCSGIVGGHRFYLEQRVFGVAYLALALTCYGAGYAGFVVGVHGEVALLPALISVATGGALFVALLFDLLCMRWLVKIANKNIENTLLLELLSEQEKSCREAAADSNLES